MSFDRSSVAFPILLLGCAVVVGCPGSLENPERFTGAGVGGGSNCGDVPTTLLLPKCATSACHDADKPAGELDLTGADLGMRLKDLDSGTTACAGRKIIDTANPSESLLYTKCQATFDCGASQMPLTGDLSSGELACLEAWVEEISGGTIAGSGGAAGTGGATSASSSTSGSGGSGGNGSGGGGGN